MPNRSAKINAGIVSAAGAYMMWGFLPIYWKFIDGVPALEILAHRIFWSVIFLLGLLAVAGKMGSARREAAAIAEQRKKIAGVLAATVLVTINWFIYIWAVNDSRILETSLGYYITPLVNILLGIIILKERLTGWQMAAVGLAALGVLNQTVHAGGVPWVSLALAVSFGLYGLCKKMLNIGAITGLTLETLLLSPAAAGYLVWAQYQGHGALSLAQPVTACFLLGTGVVTAIPLLLFANAANLIPLSVLGFTQYLSPTIALFVGIFLYHEPFTTGHVMSFACIWAALIVFSISQTRESGRSKAVTAKASPEAAK